MKHRGLAVVRVEPDSIAGELGLGPGDRVVAINGQPVRDLIDYRFLECDEDLAMEVEKTGGEKWLLEVEKDYDQRLGLDFGQGGFGRTIRCSNKCVFCFVDQMPQHMRSTLYVKDDDFRHSFWSGNFITLTNVGDQELQRIAGQRLSPLYISVHATNPGLRERLLGNPRAGLIMEQLRYLAASGIEMHTQVVLCPGLNDGKELARTVEDLAGLWPEVSSLAVVPVGLTRFRQRCYPLRPFHPEEARRTVRWIDQRQEEFIRKFNYPFVFASDEFYLLAGKDFPPAERYADFPQTENGVGLTRLFLDRWAEARERLPRELPGRRVTLATGTLGQGVLGPVVARLNDVRGLQVSIKSIKNHFFGEQVTVAGLITGGDLMAQISPEEAGDLVVLPAVMLKKDEAVFLDDVTLTDLAAALNTPVAVAEGPGQLVDILLAGPEAALYFAGKSV